MTANYTFDHTAVASDYWDRTISHREAMEKLQSSGLTEEQSEALLDAGLLSHEVEDGQVKITIIS